MILVLVAAAAALTVTIVSTAGTAGASSGGTSVSGSDSDGGGGKYKRLWEDTSRRHKRWARHTAECESGKDPDPIGDGFRTQAVVAVAFKKRHGTIAWPTCG